jgi:hypothetical protein
MQVKKNLGKGCIMKDEGEGQSKVLKTLNKRLRSPFFRTNENNVKLGAKTNFGGENPVFLL